METPIKLTFSGKRKFLKKKEIPERPTTGWAVDGSTINSNPGQSEYRCIDIATGIEIFKINIGWATNNIAEYLAIVTAAIYAQEKDEQINIYSDSEIAINWVKHRYYNTYMKYEENPEALILMRESLEWLKKNKVKAKILKWYTWKWGEIPADFGRKYKKITKF